MGLTDGRTKLDRRQCPGHSVGLELVVPEVSQ